MKLAACLIGALLSICPLSGSVTLDFNVANDASGTWSPVPEGYGDNVATSPQGGFVYIISGSGTPNVTFALTGADHYESSLSDNYGTLVDVLAPTDTNPSDGTAFMTITLTAASGYFVTLNSFDVANYLTNPVTFDINVTSAVGGDGPFNISYSDFTTTTYDTVTPLITGSQVVLTITFGVGTAPADFALDNLTFSQSVPEPTTMALILAATLGLVLRRSPKSRIANRI
jgi:hypothetical protein